MANEKALALEKKNYRKTVMARFLDEFGAEYKLVMKAKTPPETVITADPIEVIDEVPQTIMEPEKNLQEELKDIVEEAEVLPVPDDAHIQKFLTELLEKDEDKLIEILRKLK